MLIGSAAMKYFDNVDIGDLPEAFNVILSKCLSKVGRVVDATGVKPAATGEDNVLAKITIPANTLGTGDQQAQRLLALAAGAYGATSNHKRVKVILGPTTATVGSAVVGGAVIADTGDVTTNGGGFYLSANVLRSGASTQLSVATSGSLAPVTTTLTDTSDIVIAITGNATTAATDIALNYFAVDAMA